MKKNIFTYLSIIIVNYNNNTGLRKTLSFLKKDVHTFIDNGEIEIILIDGLSSDNSLKTIQEYSNIIKYSISEKDYGIYDAMNKGIYNSFGKYCYFLNTNDQFNIDAFNELIFTIKNDDFDLLLFPVNRFSNKNEQVGIKSPRNLTSDDFLDDMPVCHQGAIFKRTHILYYDSSYKIIADKDLIYRYIKRTNFKVKYSDSILMNYYEDGYSTKNIKQWKFENIIFCVKNFNQKRKLLYYIASYLITKLFR